ncbi:hypothetical protein OG555_12790 [Kribbella sp. NBC_01484]|uniref:hypothetical protein n=1 Tax=Kribbella sp. NBC_01484 TaxID=2903579 RepID=UPI002E3811D0|nr:hypothetical protein [Kribbella sp. NBC_01484]
MDAYRRRTPDAAEVVSHPEQPSTDDGRSESEHQEPARAEQSSDLRARMMRDDTFARLEYLPADEAASQTSEPPNRHGGDTKPSTSAPADNDRAETSHGPSDGLRARMMRDDTFARLEYLPPADSPSEASSPSSYETSPADAGSASAPDEGPKPRQRLDDFRPAMSESPENTPDEPDQREQEGTDGHGTTNNAASADTHLVDTAVPTPQPSGVERDPAGPADGPGPGHQREQPEVVSPIGDGNHTPSATDTSIPSAADEDAVPDAVEGDQSSAGPDMSIEGTGSSIDPDDSSAASGAVEPTRAQDMRSSDGEAAAVNDNDDGSGTDGGLELREILVARDKHWNSELGSLPRCSLPEFARADADDTSDALGPNARRELEYQGAAEYIIKNADERPWLKPVADSSREVQRIFVSIDQGNGHAHLRHGPMGDDKLYADRVAFLQDPAQLDAVKREAGVDGLNPGKRHYCGAEATRIHDAMAFVAAFAGAIEHPTVQRALNTPPDGDIYVAPVEIPISEVLGSHGHEYCSGYRLAGEWPESGKLRAEWIKARTEGRDPAGIPEPEAERIRTFEGGSIELRFKVNPILGRYEVSTMFVNPPVDDDS